MRNRQTLTILSGLPGCGKTTLAKRLRQNLGCPILAVDDVVSALPDHLRQQTDYFWEDMVHILLELAAAQLVWGNSVIVDSVFMGMDDNQTQHRWSDRQRACKIAQRHQIDFRPIYLFISDEDVWRQRLADRAKQFPDAPVATWTQVDTQRRYFEPWQPDQALFLDSLNPAEENAAAAMDYIINPDVTLSGWN